MPLQNPLLQVPTQWPNAPVYTQQQLQPSLYYPSASMIQPLYQPPYQQPYQQQFQYPTAAQQITPPSIIQVADRNMPPTIIPDNSAVLWTTPHQSYIDQTRTKQSKTIKIVNPKTMKEVDTSKLASPTSSACSTPTESKTVDKLVESKNNKVCLYVASYAHTSKQHLTTYTYYSYT